MAESNLFLNTAPFYDLDCVNHDVTDDLPLYRRLAAQQGSPVLELACGTGRVTIDLAAHGHEIWGIDSSPPMLHQLQKKLARLPADVRERLHVMRMDMRSLDLKMKFKLILIPYRSFQALLQPQDVQSCLASVRSHLDEGGLFVFDILRMSQLVQSLPKNVDLPDWEVNLPSGERMVRTNRLLGLDRNKRVFSLEHVYRIMKPDGSQREFRDRLDLKVYSEDEMGELLLANGFKVVKTLADYDGKNLGGGEDFIFFAEKS